MKNYHKILGIDEDSTESQIKSAYRKLSLKCHPDKATGTEDKFRELTEAYDALINSLSVPQIKKITPARKRKGTNVQVTLPITQEELISETSTNIVTIRQILCTTCSGTGSSIKTLIKCEKCGGSGIDRISALIGPKKFCANCKGYGDIPQDNGCKKCSGSGLIQEKIHRTVKIDRGNQNNIIFPDSGNYLSGGGDPGDLIVVLQVEDKSLYQLSGKNIRGTVNISPSQAVLGDLIHVEVFGDAVEVKIPPGTKHGDLIEKLGAGLSKKGSLILTVILNIPTSISKEEKELYTKLLKLQKGYL